MLRHKICDTVKGTFQVDFEIDFLVLFLWCGGWNDFDLGGNGIFCLWLLIVYICSAGYQYNGALL